MPRVTKMQSTRTVERVTAAGYAYQQRAKGRDNGEGSIYFQASKQRYAASVTQEDGCRKTVYGKTREEAGKKLTEALKNKHHGLPVLD